VSTEELQRLLSAKPFRMFTIECEGGNCLWSIPQARIRLPIPADGRVTVYASDRGVMFEIEQSALVLGGFL